jgi:hypothetical protein
VNATRSVPGALLPVLLFMTLGCKLYQLNHIDINDTTEKAWRTATPKTALREQAAAPRYSVVGIVQEVRGGEVVFGYRNITQPLQMGDVVFIVIGERRARAEVSFPMMTVTRCRLTGDDAGLLGEVRKGAPVLRQPGP